MFGVLWGTLMAMDNHRMNDQKVVANINFFDCFLDFGLNLFKVNCKCYILIYFALGTATNTSIAMILSP